MSSLARRLCGISSVLLLALLTQRDLRKPTETHRSCCTTKLIILSYRHSLWFQCERLRRLPRIMAYASTAATLVFPHTSEEEAEQLQRPIQCTDADIDEKLTATTFSVEETKL